MSKMNDCEDVIYLNKQTFSCSIRWGEEWEKSLMKYTIFFIESNFNVSKKKGEFKKDLIARIRVREIIKWFNDSNAIKDKILWRPAIGEPFIELTLKHKAFVHCGNVVAFFEEKSAFCCVEPQFINCT